MTAEEKFEVWIQERHGEGTKPEDCLPIAKEAYLAGLNAQPTLELRKAYHEEGCEDTLEQVIEIIDQECANWRNGKPFGWTDEVREARRRIKGLQPAPREE